MSEPNSEPFDPRYDLTDAQTLRQDEVNEAIFDMVNSFLPEDKQLEWDIEWIGDIRDSVRYWIVDYHKLMDEQTFFPYLEP